MRWEDRIAADPDVMAGKPVVRGTRLTVEFIIELLAAGSPEADVLRNYPQLAPDDIRACLAYAGEAVRLYRTVPVPG
jgi:uncharacterized protein (DUF433 family)